MTLTGKQKKQLKALGQKMTDDVRLGKGGLSEGFIAHVNELLSRRELLKLRFTDVHGPERKALADEVCAALSAHCVAVVGQTMLLYRENLELEPAQRSLRE